MANSDIDPKLINKFWIRTPKKVLPNGMSTGNHKVTLVAWVQHSNGTVLYSRATCNPDANSKTGKRDRFDNARAHDEATHKLLHRRDSFTVSVEAAEGETTQHLILRDIVTRSLQTGRSNTLYARTAIDALSNPDGLE